MFSLSRRTGGFCVILENTWLVLSQKHLSQITAVERKFFGWFEWIRLPLTGETLGLRSPSQFSFRFVSTNRRLIGILVQFFARNSGLFQYGQNCALGQIFARMRDGYASFIRRSVENVMTSGRVVQRKTSLFDK
jgi:hypothetical protein